MLITEEQWDNSGKKQRSLPYKPRKEQGIWQKISAQNMTTTGSLISREITQNKST